MKIKQKKLELKTYIRSLVQDVVDKAIASDLDGVDKDLRSSVIETPNQEECVIVEGSDLKPTNMYKVRVTDHVWRSCYERSKIISACTVD